MRIVLLSDFFNHHLQHVSEALYNQENVDYHFIAVTPLPDYRTAMGWHMEQSPNFVCPAYESEHYAHRASQLLDEADLLISGAGSAPEKMVRRCISANKLIFRYSERPLKKGIEIWKWLPRFLRWNWWNPPGKPIYLLCASAYSAADYAKFGMFRNRTYKWGYFPEAKYYEDIDSFLSQKRVTDILWCGRFLDWKHPDDAIQVAKRLKDEGYSFQLKFVGSGELENKLRTMVKDFALEEYVEFHGAATPEQVRSYMEQAGIYLFTSDMQEGWGAVLNESMNSGCAIVASHAAGAVPYLLKNGENGLIYRSGDVDTLYEKVKSLLNNPKEQKRVGRAAYETIVKEWNAQIAADRVVRLADAIMKGEKHPNLYESGPCSRAEIMHDNWF